MIQTQTCEKVREQLLTTDEVAEWLKVNRATVIGLVHRRVLPCINVGNGLQNKSYRFKRSDLEAFLSTYHEPETFEYSETVANGRPVNIHDEIAKEKLRKRGVIR